jgi:glyoxylase-like metal-dependent hydrolase (beta-lactamase superfamily II)
VLRDDFMPRVAAIIPSNLFSCTYVIRQANLTEAMIVDPGEPDVSVVVAYLERNAITRVSHIFLTHEHFDHIGGADEIRRKYHSSLICSAACAAGIADPKKNMSYYMDNRHAFRIQADYVWEDLGWRIDCGGVSIEAVVTPGHSPGGVCLAIRGSLFTGDTLLGNTSVPTHLPGGSKAELKKSVCRILDQFAPDTTGYPGHGSQFLLREIDPQKVTARRS